MKICKFSIYTVLIYIPLLVYFPVLAQSPISKESKLEKVADGFQFVEGPVWKDGSGLLFSDIPTNTIYKWIPEAGTTLYLKPSGNSNGLALDKQGKLLLAQHGNRQVARMEMDGSITVLASYYEGKRLNSPNDIAVKSDGSIFFTDPPYGINPEQEELGFYGIYRISLEGELMLLDKSIRRPNGITFSPDESKIYVSDDEDRKIYVWDVTNDSTISNRKLFAFMEPEGDADGMKVDSKGNLYAAGPLGVWIFSPEGTLLDTIHVPGQTSNCNWGDDDRKTLYITSGDAVYKIRIK